MGTAKRLGQRVRDYRSTAKLTQEELAEKVRVVPVTISRLERGVTIPSLKTLEKIAKALGVGLHDLFDFRTERDEKDKRLDAFTRLLKRRDAADIEMIHDLAVRIFLAWDGTP